MDRSVLLPIALAMVPWSLQAQDQCSTALPVVLGTYTVDLINGTEVPNPICAPNGTDNLSAAEWYTFTATHDTAITITTDLAINGGGDTRFHVYNGTCGALTCWSGDDDSGNGYLSTATFDVTEGVTYTIAFDNRWSSNGFQFQVLEAEPPPPGPSGFTAQNLNTAGNVYGVLDMNSDGLDDVVSVGATNININYQLAEGGFNTVNITTSTASNPASWSMCAGDLDNNGYPDLMYGGQGGISLMFANADATAYSTLNEPEYIFCQRTNMADINNDGHLDAFSCHDVAPNCYYLNDGSNNFAFHQGGLGDTPDGGNYGSIWIDYDNDHDLDMFIAKCRGGTSPASIDQLHRNNGDGTYTEIAASMNLADYQQSWSSAWGDFDNDGDLDILIGASSFTGGGHKLMRNDGSTFTNVTVGSGYDLFTGTSIEFVTHDFDNDGYLDVLGGGTLMHNNGNMTFTPTNVQPGNGPIGDLNNDGFMDVQNGSTAYLNDGNDNNYLRVRLIGTASNYSAIGARVMVTSALGTQMREVRSGDGFRYMSSLMPHFGLGTDEAVSNVTVYWPSGHVSSVEDPAINGTLTITEDSSTGISESAATELTLFPTPAVDQLHVRSAQDLGTRAVRVTDLAGKLVLRGTLRNGVIDVSTLNSGLYLLQIDGAQILKGKFIKQ